MNDRKDAIDFVFSYFKKEGFKRRGNKFVLINDEVTRIIEFQSSNYWRGIYINLGVYFSGLGDKPAVTQIYDCHLSYRINSLPIVIEDYTDEGIMSDIIAGTVLFFKRACDFTWLLNGFPTNVNQEKIEVMNTTNDKLFAYLEVKVGKRSTN